MQVIELWLRVTPSIPVFEKLAGRTRGPTRIRSSDYYASGDRRAYLYTLIFITYRIFYYGFQLLCRDIMYFLNPRAPEIFEAALRRINEVLGTNDRPVMETIRRYSPIF